MTTRRLIILLLTAGLLAACQSANSMQPASTAMSSSSEVTNVSRHVDGHWLTGTWDGPSGRIIDVWSVRSDGTAHGTMGISGQGQGRAQIHVDGSRVHVVNGINNAFDLTLTSEGRLTGTVTLAVDHTVQPWAATKRKSKPQPCWQPSPADMQGQLYGPPRYCVLDTWVFSTGRIQTVVKVEDDTIVMAGADLPGLCAGCVVHFDRNLGLRSIQRVDGQPLGAPNGWRMIGDDWHFWDFPLATQKSWHISATGLVDTSFRSYAVDCKALAYEDVTTQAGTFKAFKVERLWRFKLHQNDADRGDRWHDTVWFAPAAKTVVKRITYNTVNVADRNWELVSYNLK